MEQEQRKILLICNTSTNVITFRVPLIRTLKAKGLKVSVIAFDDKRKEEIETEGVEFYCVSGSNTSLNPLKMLGLKGEYRKIIEKINPDIVFTFMLKPNTFGVLAAKNSGVKNIYSMVEGAGDAFSNNSLKWKIIRFVICKLYKKSFKGCKRVFFLNNDDKAEFVKRKLVKESQCEIVHGIGVDLQKFAYKPIINHKTFLMVARLVKTKGVFEYCKCARIVKQKYPEAQFNYLGGEHSLKVSDIQEYLRSPVNAFKEAKGLFKKDWFKPILEGVLGVTLGILLSKFYGIAGIIAGYLISSLFVAMPIEDYVVFKCGFGKNALPHYLMQILIFVISCAVAFAVNRLFALLPLGLGWFCLKAVICITIPVVLYLCVTFKTEEFSYYKTLMINLLRSNKRH